MRSSKGRFTKHSRRSRTRRSTLKLGSETHPTLGRSVAGALSALRPPPHQTVAEWAEAERFLSPEYAAEPGRWKSRPYQVEPMEALSDPGVEGVLYVAASQGGGKTELVINAVGFHMDRDPCPILLVEPNLEMADALSKDRLAPTIRDTPALRGKVRDPRSRDSGNTVRHKAFTGGHITIVGANSAAGLAMRPIRFIGFDEIDRYPPSAGTEGDPVRLAWTRTRAFWNRKALYVTSPGIKGASRSEALWARSDQREWTVPCPDCGKYQHLKWSQVQWEKGEAGEHLPRTAVYVCEKCGSAWSDAQRWRTIRKGRWKATAPLRGIAGFRLPGISVLGLRLSELVEQWVEAQGNPELLQVFVNTVLAEWWEQRGRSPRGAKLMKRREAYPERRTGRQLENGKPEKEPMVPKGVVVMTSGTDVHPDRVEVQVEGWGIGEENWKLEYHVLYGDPTAEPVWEELWELLLRPRWMERGGVDYLRSSCIDSGYAAQSVYGFVLPRPIYRTPDGRRGYTWAVKGVTGTGQVWPTRPSRNTIAKVPVYPVKVDSAKDVIYGRAEGVEKPGPGYIHFPGNPGVGEAFGEDYFRQFAAEHAIDGRDKRGFPIRRWELKKGHQRNEAFDTAVYNYAGLCALYSMGLDVKKEAARLEVFEPPPDDPGIAPAIAPRPTASRSSGRGRRRVSRSSYLG